MFGDSIMVCPVTNPMYYLPNFEKIEAEKVRKVYLPEGGWYDFYTNAYYKGGQYILTDAPIDKIPLFVREGSIIPICEPAQSTEELSGDIKLCVYSGQDAEYDLYEDGFDGYDYEKGDYIITHIRWNEKEHKIDIERKDSCLNFNNDNTHSYKILKDDIEIFGH